MNNTSLALDVVVVLCYALVISVVVGVLVWLPGHVLEMVVKVIFEQPS